MPAIKMIKSDAQIPIVFGAPFIQRIQAIMLFLTETRSVEELNSFKELIEKKEELSDPWMDHLQTIMILLQEIESSAEKTNQITEVDSDTITTQDS